MLKVFQPIQKLFEGELTVLHAYDLHRISRLAEELFPHIAELSPEKRTGGFLCLVRENGPVVGLTMIGEPSQDTAGKYEAFAREKAWRLMSLPEDQSSFQSRVPDQQQWGGAVWVSGGTLSFSGLPEKLDEAFVVVLALRLRYLNRKKAEEIVAISQNEYWDKVQHWL